MENILEFNEINWLKAKERLEYYKPVADRVAGMDTEERANILDGLDSITLTELNQYCGLILAKNSFRYWLNLCGYLLNQMAARGI